MTQYVMRLPDLGEGLVSAEISEWHVQTGDIVREDQPLVEMSTDKALVEVAAPVSGRVVSLSGAPGESIAVGAPLVIFDLDELSASTPAAASTQSPTQSPTQSSTQSSTHISTHQPQRVRASPATRRLAYEAGINLQTISGSGPGGRIVRGDLVRDESTSNPSVKEEVSDVLGPYTGKEANACATLAHPRRSAPRSRFCMAFTLFKYAVRVGRLFSLIFSASSNIEFFIDYSFLLFCNEDIFHQHEFQITSKKHI